MLISFYFHFNFPKPFPILLPIGHILWLLVSHYNVLMTIWKVPQNLCMFLTWKSCSIRSFVWVQCGKFVKLQTNKKSTDPIQCKSYTLRMLQWPSCQFLNWTLPLYIFAFRNLEVCIKFRVLKLSFVLLDFISWYMYNWLEDNCQQDKCPPDMCPSWRLSSLTIVLPDDCPLTVHKPHDSSWGLLRPHLSNTSRCLGTRDLYQKCLYDICLNTF